MCAGFDAHPPCAPGAGGTSIDRSRLGEDSQGASRHEARHGNPPRRQYDSSGRNAVGATNRFSGHTLGGDHTSRLRKSGRHNSWHRRNGDQERRICLRLGDAWVDPLRTGRNLIHHRGRAGHDNGFQPIQLTGADDRRTVSPHGRRATEDWHLPAKRYECSPNRGCCTGRVCAIKRWVIDRTRTMWPEPAIWLAEHRVLWCLPSVTTGVRHRPAAGWRNAACWHGRDGSSG
jgi:hypothetical protein